MGTCVVCMHLSEVGQHTWSTLYCDMQMHSGDSLMQTCVLPLYIEISPLRVTLGSCCSAAKTWPHCSKSTTNSPNLPTRRLYVDVPGPQQSTYNEWTHYGTVLEVTKSMPQVPLGHRHMLSTYLPCTRSLTWIECTMLVELCTCVCCCKLCVPVCPDWCIQLCLST